MRTKNSKRAPMGSLDIPNVPQWHSYAVTKPGRDAATCGHGWVNQEKLKCVFCDADICPFGNHALHGGACPSA